MAETEVVAETDAYTVVRRYSAAGWTETTEYKPGHEPPAPSVCEACGRVSE